MGSGCNQRHESLGAERPGKGLQTPFPPCWPPSEDLCGVSHSLEVKFHSHSYHGSTPGHPKLDAHLRVDTSCLSFHRIVPPSIHDRRITSSASYHPHVDILVHCPLLLCCVGPETQTLIHVLSRKSGGQDIRGTGLWDRDPFFAAPDKAPYASLDPYNYKSR